MYIENLYNEKLKMMNETYFKTMENFLIFLNDNNLKIKDLKNVTSNQKEIAGYKINKNNESSYILISDNPKKIIEITFIPKNAYKKEETNLTELKEGEVQDITYIEDDKILLYTSKEKILLQQNENHNYIYSPNKPDWELFVKKTEKEEYYDSIIIMNQPTPQLHFIKNKKNKKFYQLITFLDGKQLNIELFKNKNDKEPQIIKDYYFNNNNIKIPK